MLQHISAPSHSSRLASNHPYNHQLWVFLAHMLPRSVTELASPSAAQSVLESARSVTELASPSAAQSVLESAELELQSVRRLAWGKLHILRKPSMRCISLPMARTNSRTTTYNQPV